MKGALYEKSSSDKRSDAEGMLKMGMMGKKLKAKKKKK